MYEVCERISLGSRCRAIASKCREVVSLCSAEREERVMRGCDEESWRWDDASGFQACPSGTCRVYEPLKRRQPCQQFRQKMAINKEKAHFTNDL
ncbi:unnamed protein product [Boreogadus saida]